MHKRDKIKATARNIAWLLLDLILNLIAGAIAKAIYPGAQGGGLVATISNLPV